MVEIKAKQLRECGKYWVQSRDTVMAVIPISTLVLSVILSAGGCQQIASANLTVTLVTATTKYRCRVQVQQDP